MRLGILTIPVDGAKIRHKRSRARGEKVNGDRLSLKRGSVGQPAFSYLEAMAWSPIVPGGFTRASRANDAE